eukprot:TRINITY_DN29546_c0_g1_i1.p1 TRINITY_DN29546_c0_g1~~TRINITY_DN29546_c0_g1_i1.p1  ORF type:complete len:654 (+),score=131.31 TRINITY_DN29546_c0_g1_i1:217-1962(+)
MVESDLGSAFDDDTMGMGSALGSYVSDYGHEGECGSDSGPSSNVASSSPTATKKERKKTGAKAETLFLDHLDDVLIDNSGNIRDNYKMGKLISKGKFGEVRKAMLESTSAVRIVKRIPCPTLKKGGSESQDEFEKQVDFLRTLLNIQKMMDHPAILKLYEIYEDNKFLYLVMEHCRSGDLSKLLTSGGEEIIEFEAAVLMNQILRGIGYMHAHDVCHRDINPEHVLLTIKAKDENARRLTTAGGLWTEKTDGRQSQFEDAVKLSGFSSACQCDSPEEVLMEDRGMMSHKSPQMLKLQYTSKTDIWSCGVVFYQILGRDLPFKGEDEDEFKAKVKTGKFSWNDEWMSRSQEAMTFQRQLLNRIEKKRPSVREALQDPWLVQQNSMKEESEINDQTITRLRSFRKLNKFQQVALKAIVSLLPDGKVSAGRDTFMRMDEDGDGLITVSELRTAMLKHQHKKGLPEGETDAEAIFAAKKEQKVAMRSMKKKRSFIEDGVLLPFTYTEFLAATFNRSKYCTFDVCQSAFRLFDKDDSGKLDKHELARGRLLGELTGSEIEQLLQELDTNGDEEINFDEFLEMMSQS